MLTAILGLIPGLFTTVSSITSAISNERIALINAKTDQEKAEIQQNIADLQSKQAVLIAESGQSNIPAIVQFLIALGPAAYIAKIFLWDKTIGSIMGCVGLNTPASCNLYITDPLDANQWWVITAVVGFYFLSNWKFNK